MGKKMFKNDATEIRLEKPATITAKHLEQRAKNEPNNEPYPGGWSPLLVLAGITCCLGSALPAGYNIGVINNPADLMKRFCNETIEERFNVQLTEETLNIVWATVVSIFLVGGVTGSLSAGWLADKLGRRGALAIGNTCGIIGAIFFISAKAANSVEILMVGRLFVGLSGGLATSLVPMYMTETAPLKLRGAVGVLCQLGITCGVLLGQIVSLDSTLGTENSWPIMLVAFSPLCLTSLGLLFVLPESPKYLYVIRSQGGKAIKELSRLRNMDVSLLSNEVASLDQEAVTAEATEIWTIGRVVKDPSLRLPLLLVCTMQAGQQLSGVNAVFFYSNKIFQEAKLGETGAQYATLGTGVINVVMALIAVPVMSLFGRRTLFLLSCYLAVGCLTFLCFAIIFIEAAAVMPWLCMIAVLAYVLFYGLGLGPIPYFIGSELFDVGPRPAAMALGGVSNWGANFIVGMGFESVMTIIGPYSFLIFSGCTLLLALFNRVYLPETRGRDTMEISATMTKGFKSRPNYTPVAQWRP
ncbi:solute carrier family 2, facilitated glucose transporter member 1-like isoform X1 [Neodiprion fabricii]|uniref:solute carrier family 2, facilitated glucose transporter member 1-like isoform X1 n=2 Tax=Neodiprion fabricii TaxID=2872261 RepID=UPI001ED8FC58|nr:solute carrier family 2, facilitated glucose transporter member 1-like isoform X1 [Neodiprion fabricii]